MKETLYFLKFFLVATFGWTGWHRFLEKKFFTAILFLLSFGLFFVGWIFDICKVAYNNEK